MTQWIVEEKDYDSGAVIYTESFSNYQNALDAYIARKELGSMNTLSLLKEEGSKILIEEKTQRSFLTG